MSEYYKNYRIENIEQLKSIFPDGKADESHWCVLSTSGVHGLFTTLNDLKKRDEGEKLEITVLVIKPRIVSMLYGHIRISKEDIPFLRKLANSSVRYIGQSQVGNI